MHHHFPRTLRQSLPSLFHQLLGRPLHPTLLAITDPLTHERHFRPPNKLADIPLCHATLALQRPNGSEIRDPEMQRSPNPPPSPPASKPLEQPSQFLSMLRPESLTIGQRLHRHQRWPIPTTAGINFKQNASAPLLACRLPQTSPLGASIRNTSTGVSNIRKESTMHKSFAAFALALTLGAKTPIPHSQPSAQNTYTDLKILTAQADDQAGKLSASIASANFAPAFARERLQALRNDLNAIGQNVGQLLAARHLLPSPEREALEKAIPALQDAASRTQSAIRDYNESALASWFMKNRELVQRIKGDTGRAHEILARGNKLESSIERENRAASRFNQSLSN